MPFWSILYAVAAAQAALLALALWRRPVNTAGNRVLAVWIALVGFDLAVKAVYFDAPAAGLLKLYHFVGLFPFLYGSLFFVYVRALTQARHFGRRDVVHLAGFALAVMINAGVFLQGDAQTGTLFAHLVAGGTWPHSPWLDIALFAYSLSYVSAALAWVRRYRRRLRQRRSDADVMSLRWIDAMALSQIVIWCIAMIQWLARIPGIDYPLIYGAVAAWVFVVGYLSLSQVSIAVEPQEVPVPADDPPADARFPAVEARLSRLMAQERLFREPALTIGQLARRSGYPEYLVSLVINRCFNDNFWGYINRLRIEAARACLADGDDTRTILDIAYACGFTSKSTFNAAFKRQTGETPSRYRQRHTRSTQVESA